MNALTVLLLLATTGCGLWLWRAAALHRRAVAHLYAGAEPASPAEAAERVVMTRPPEEGTFPRRLRWVSVVAGAAAGGGIWIGLSWPIEVAAAFGLLAAALAHIGEEVSAGVRATRIETQLSELIDMLVASLRAGAAVLAGFEAALRDAREPLRPHLEEVVGRIRFGEDPREVIMALSERIPLETFRLFAMSLAIHWEVGGSLASTLATVGRTIRDRIELERRVRAQGIEAQASVAAVLAITYLLAYLMWQSSPERTEAFVLTGVGTTLIAIVVGLQAVGLIWMSRISRSGF